MNQPHQTPVTPGEPYCSNCDYALSGLTESSKCPECGKPLVEVLQRRGAVMLGRRFKSQTVIFGQPLLHIAMGPDANSGERIGRARGIIAIGDDALGWLALGGFARGIVALGGQALGLVAIGGMSLGLLSMGGLSLGGFALGGAAIALFANGGGAVGVVANGGGAVGFYALGGGGWGKYVQAGNRTDREAVAFFGPLRAALGSTARAGPLPLLALLGWFAIGAILIASVPAAAVLLALRKLDHAEQSAPARTKTPGERGPPGETHV